MGWFYKNVRRFWGSIGFIRSGNENTESPYEKDNENDYESMNTDIDNLINNIEMNFFKNWKKRHHLPRGEFCEWFFFFEWKKDDATSKYVYERFDKTEPDTDNNVERSRLTKRL